MAFLFKTSVLVLSLTTATMSNALGLANSDDQYVPVYTKSDRFSSHLNSLSLNSYPTLHSEPLYRQPPQHNVQIYDPDPKSIVYSPSPIYSNPQPIIKPKVLSYSLNHLHESKPYFEVNPIVHKPEPLTYEIQSSYEPKLSYQPQPSYEVKPVFESHNTYEPSYEPQLSYKPAPAYSFEKKVVKPYAFDYGVKDAYHGTNFGHSESSDGKEVKGSYTVALPDGRIQKVTYTADHYNGFQAKVTYEGEAHYPEYVPHVKHKPKHHHSHSKLDLHNKPIIYEPPLHHEYHNSLSNLIPPVHSPHSFSANSIFK